MSDIRPRRVPHFAIKTITHSAPEFSNNEQDVIRQSFSTGNHTWMKEALPVELGPDAINLLRRQRMERNRLAEPVPQTWSKMTQLWGGGFYQEFEYMPDPYDRKFDRDRDQRIRSLEEREKIANHEFRYASQEKRMKHEPLIQDLRKKEQYPYLGGDHDEEIPCRHAPHRTPRWLDPVVSGRHWDHEAGGPEPIVSDVSFMAGKGSGLNDNSCMSRMTLPTMVQRLQSRLDADWEDTTVVVSATDQDLVQIAFHMASVDSERGVLAYMNVLSKDVDLLAGLGLQKVSQLWGLKRDFTSELQASRGDADVDGDAAPNPEHTWVFFLLKPKWVKMRPTDAYYTVHPRAQGSAFRMSTAGSSVLLSLGSSVLDSTELMRRGPVGAPVARGGVALGDGGQRVDLSVIEKAVGVLPAIGEHRNSRR